MTAVVLDDEDWNSLLGRVRELERGQEQVLKQLEDSIAQCDALRANVEVLKDRVLAIEAGESIA